MVVVGLVGILVSALIWMISFQQDAKAWQKAAEYRGDQLEEESRQHKKLKEEFDELSNKYHEMRKNCGRWQIAAMEHKTLIDDIAARIADTQQLIKEE